jgi:hypothetical protein
MHMYLLYIYDYDSQTNSGFVHNCRHRTIDANPSTQKKGPRRKTRDVDILPAASKIMLPKSLKHINLYHSSFSIFLEGADNLDSHGFLVFQVPAFQNLPKCS